LLLLFGAKQAGNLSWQRGYLTSRSNQKKRWWWWWSLSLFDQWPRPLSCVFWFRRCFLLLSKKSRLIHTTKAWNVFLITHPCPRFDKNLNQQKKLFFLLLCPCAFFCHQSFTPPGITFALSKINAQKTNTHLINNAKTKHLFLPFFLSFSQREKRNYPEKTKKKLLESSAKYTISHHIVKQKTTKSSSPLLHNIISFDFLTDESKWMMMMKTKEDHYNKRSYLPRSITFTRKRRIFLFVLPPR